MKVHRRTETREVLEVGGHVFDLDGLLPCQIALPRQADGSTQWYLLEGPAKPIRTFDGEPFFDVHVGQSAAASPDFWRTDKPDPPMDAAEFDRLRDSFLDPDGWARPDPPVVIPPWLADELEKERNDGR